MNKQVDYAEQLLEAMKVVSQAEVQGIQFDRTIQCTVTNVEDADNGIYTVNNGSASFIAYSKDTDYKVKDNVLVTIPQGDYNQQKIIIGKYIAKNSKPFVYKNPFDYFVDITGNLVSNSHGEFSILANNVTDNLICPEGPVASWTCLGSSSVAPLSGYDTLGLKADFMSLLKGFKVVSGNYGLRVLVTYLNPVGTVEEDAQKQELYNDTLNQYTASQDYLLNLHQKDEATVAAVNAAVQDVYGVDYAQQLEEDLEQLSEQYYKLGTLSDTDYATQRQELIDTATASREAKIQNLPLVNSYFTDRANQVDLWKDMLKSTYTSKPADILEHYQRLVAINVPEIKKEVSDAVNYSQKAFYLDIDDMYGDPYDFDTYYEQQAIFDISDIDQIVSIQVDLYQSWEEDNEGNKVGSFKDITGERISYTDEIFADELYNDNIFVKDIYLALGYDESQFDTDKLVLYTANNLTYSPTATNDVNTKTIKARWVHKNDSGEIVVVEDLADITNAELRWYRYKLSAAAADIYSSTHWRKIETTDTEVFSSILTDDWTCELIPNPELSTEQIKAILLYGTNNVIRSNNLTFTNETAVPDGATIQQLEDFYLEPSDGLNGVYNFYGNDNKILNRTTNDDGTELSTPMTPQNEIRHLKTMIKGSTLADIEYIKWSIPWNYSMITPTNEHGQPLFTVQNINGVDQPVANNSNLSRWVFSYDNDFVYLSYPIAKPVNYTKMDNWNWLFYYTIKDTYVKSYTHNSVSCEIIKDRITYSYTYNLRFGYNSTNGSDYTLLLSFLPFEDSESADVAMLVPGDTTGHLHIHLDVMDQNGTILDWHNNTIFGEVSTVWSWATCVRRSAYFTKYVQISHENIPQYRKKLDDININEDGSNAIPKYYLLAAPNITEATTYSSIASGAYDDTWVTINDNRYRQVNYATQIFTKKQETSADTEPHITMHSSKGQAGATNLIGKYQDIYLQSTAALTMDELYVLQVSISGLVPYDLVAYLPIPLYKPYIRNNIKYKPSFIGPDLIRYDSAGMTDYYKDPCKVIWSTTGRYVVDDFLNTEVFGLFIPPYGIPGYNTYENGKDYGYLNPNNILIPLSTYLDNAPPYGIQYKMGGEIYWTQPLYCYQNKWPNGTVNKWDGAGLLINEEAGYIIGHSITAGKKEADNTFTGVMLGDLGGSHTNLEDHLTKHTGVYGFNHGALSYALKDDGTAFIGKAGHGRIEFNGNNGQIKSSSWDESTSPHGMLMDLDDGYLKMIRQGYYTVIQIPNQSVYNQRINSAAGLYTYTLYSLRVNSSRDNEETYYLPRLFVTPELAITSDNYRPNTFYLQESLTTNYTLEDNNVEININKQIVKAGNEALINQKTSEQTNIQRADFSQGYPRFTYAVKTWTYGESLTDPTKLDYYVCQLINYTYTLATGDWSTVQEQAENLVLPDTTSFFMATAEELAVWTDNSEIDDHIDVVSWFYILIGDYQLCTPNNYWALETYYSKDSSGRYIDIGVNQPTYPLAIGSQPILGARPFRVTWDGHVYITDGDFTGNINAKSGTLGNLNIIGQLIAGGYEPTSNQPGIYGARIEGSNIYGSYINGAEIDGAHIKADYLQANLEGQLGGWYFDPSGLWNSDYAYGNSSGGIKLYSNSPNITSRNITYKGGIYLKDTAIAIENSSNAGGIGFVGLLPSGLPGGGNSKGIGLTYSWGSGESRLIADSEHIGISTTNGGNFYISNNSYGNIEAKLTCSNIVLQTASGNNNFRIYVENNAIKLSCNIPAANQSGIYARFA